ncbi:nuclear transport factor 2 family protein [Sphingomonas sp. BIUV-7]|uniref:Nuclear transport factor 2 family protein n=1 Tax=Sphingomonas natans TaxID=3063330 RepID=A0ABT8YA53_9SPHN|nr:nuclear transport factor 2 family protein [Sphingomonas sp. BIUV-7]MDO6414584.1 nuclear transport factor 2 family protein [Sphingomonas sp. BIUV-7]
MTDTGDHILDRFYGALSRGDVVAVMACCTADVRVWHGFDRILQNRAAAAAGYAAFVAAFPERVVAAVDRQPTPGGCVQQFVLAVRTATGDRRAWPVCIVVRLEDGLIARLDEYVERGASFTPEGALTATCDIEPG